MIPVDPPVHKPVTLPRESIRVDDSRNVRNFGRPIDPKDPETVKLVKLIARDGQLKPVSVRRVSRPAAPTYYVLDTGFRRMCAMTLLGFESIQCVIVEGEETEISRIARVVGENEGHKPLTPCELAHACALMRACSKDTGEPLSLAGIAEKIGRSEGYTKELLVCYDHLIPPVLAAWKGEGGPIRLPIDQAIRFAHMGKARQEDAWKEYVQRRDEGTIHGRGRPAHRAGAPRACPRRDVEKLQTDAKSLTSVLVEGRYEPIRGAKNLRLLRAAVRATLAHVLDRDAALPFKGKSK